MQIEIPLMEKEFQNSLTQEQLNIVNAAIEIYSDFINSRRAEKTLQNWIENGKPKGISIEQLNQAIEKKANAASHHRRG